MSKIEFKKKICLYVYVYVNVGMSSKIIFLNELCFIYK